MKPRARMRRKTKFLNRSHAFKAGRDAALNGSNVCNCHFSHFSSPGSTRDWEAGNKSGERQKYQEKLEQYDEYPM